MLFTQPELTDERKAFYARIEKEVSWWDLLVRPLRPAFHSIPASGRGTTLRPGMPVAAAACVAVLAGALLERPVAVKPVPQVESAQLESIQPEQVEHALEAMQMLSDFSHQVRAAVNESQM